MSDVRTRLVAALREHQPCHDKCRVNGKEHCAGCNRWVADREEHLADALLSLPDIAIMELPGGTPWDLSQGLFRLNGELLTPPAARAIAADLLAAANAAEQAATA